MFQEPTQSRMEDILESSVPVPCEVYPRGRMNLAWGHALTEQVKTSRQCPSKSPYPRGSKFEGKAPSGMQSRAISHRSLKAASNRSLGTPPRSMSRSSLVSFDPLDR